MLILGLLGMYFDAVVVEVKTFSLLFRLALAILWPYISINITREKNSDLISSTKCYAKMKGPNV